MYIHVPRNVHEYTNIYVYILLRASMGENNILFVKELIICDSNNYASLIHSFHW
jgi:hypothetical protein